MFPHEGVDLENNEGKRIKEKGHTKKLYLRNTESVEEVIDAYYLDEV